MNRLTIETIKYKIDKFFSFFFVTDFYFFNIFLLKVQKLFIRQSKIKYFISFIVVQFCNIGDFFFFTHQPSHKLHASKFKFLNIIIF